LYTSYFTKFSIETLFAYVLQEYIYSAELKY